MSPERFKRINEMLNLRQPDLTVVMENVHKSHNVSAVIRTADAVGVHKMHAVWESSKRKMSAGLALGSQNWVGVSHYDQVADAINAVRQQGMQVVVTNLSEQAIDFRDVDYTQPTAILMGQEKHGVTEEALALADHQVMIPMVGMAQSLNVSVAAAVLLYEAQRQRQAAGRYGHNQLDIAERQRILFEGGHPIYAKACRRKGIDYPELDEAGQIVAGDDWWQAMRTAK